MDFKKVLCPVCGKWLFEIKPGTSGIVKAFCKRCKEAKEIRLEVTKSE